MKTLKNFILVLVTIFNVTFSFSQITFEFLNSEEPEVVVEGQSYSNQPLQDLITNITVLNTDIIKITGPTYELINFDNISFKFNNAQVADGAIMNKFHNTGDTLSFDGTGIIYIMYNNSNAVIKIEIANPSTASINSNALSVTGLNAYPNPVVDYLNIEFESQETEVMVSVVNSAGQTVFVDNEMRWYGSNKVSVPMYDQPNGLYFVRIGDQTRKVIKQ